MANNELKLNSFEIFSIGEKLDDKLHDDGVKEKSVLTISVSKDELRKIDEDLYYRNNENNKDEYKPTEGEILVNFKNLLIIIKEKN